MQPYQMPAHIADATFKVGQKYSCNSPCDQNCTWEFTVSRRTDKSVWLEKADGQIIRKAIAHHNGRESCLPLGSYSMAPILRA